MDDARLTQIEAYLRAQGPCSASELAQALGVSQPTFSRLIARMTSRVLRIGRARATRYALMREIARAGNRWPLYRLDAQGSAWRLGVLTALHGDTFHFECEAEAPAFAHGEFRDGLFPGLPWFLDIQRPQGFLGRNFARRVASDIGVPEDLTRWRPDDVVLALLRYGEDEAGDLILGAQSLRAAQSARLSSPDELAHTERHTRYPQLAEHALQGDIVGSSAGGEQPKFTATLAVEDGHRPVIVKFSDRIDTPGGRRWADLLRAETCANATLRAHGIEAAETTVLEADSRVFLESTRFDRTAVLGRIGFIHLAAIDAAYYGHGSIRWQTFADTLEHDGWIDADDAASLRMIGWFGELIANSDMHLGNAGLILCDERPLRLAPVYDMLPMRFRPSANGEIVARAYDVPPPLPEQRDDWHRAAAAALAFWRAVSEDTMISDTFRAIADNAGRKLDLAKLRF